MTTRVGRLRIAHVLSSFGMGGQERIALELSRGQLALGHDVVAISIAPPPDGPLAALFRESGAETARVAKGAGFDATLPFRLARELRRRRIDVVHSHNPQPLLYAAPAAWLAGAGAVHTKHGANPDTAARLAMRRAAGRLVSAYVAVSPTTAEVARKNREAPESRLVVIDNGIDTSRYGRDPAARAAARAELGLPADAVVLGTVARLSPEKSQRTMIDAALPLLGPGLRLLLVGDGPESPALRAQAAGLPGGAGRWIVFAGARSDVPAMLAAMDVFVMSSVTEGLPVALVEAMASGLPVVSTAVGGIPGVLGDIGVVVPVGDVPAMTRELSLLAGDAALREKRGREGAAVATAGFGLSRMVDAYLALYRASIQAARGAPS